MAGGGGNTRGERTRGLGRGVVPLGLQSIWGVGGALLGAFTSRSKSVTRSLKSSRHSYTTDIRGPGPGSQESYSIRRVVRPLTEYRSEEHHILKGHWCPKTHFKKDKQVDEGSKKGIGLMIKGAEAVYFGKGRLREGSEGCSQIFEELSCRKMN